MNIAPLLKCKITAASACLALLAYVSPAAATLTVTTDNQQGSANTYPFTPTWTQASDSLIAGLVPSTVVGNFTNDLSTRNVATLTSDGSLTINTLPGNQGPDPVGNTTTSANYLSCGRNGGTQLIYTLPAPGTYGYNLTNITVFGGWADNGRDALEFTVWYSTISNPTHFVPLTYVNYNPSVPPSTASANRVIFTDSAGSFIAPNVAAVMFDFTTPWGENNWGGVAAITVEGTAATATASLPPPYLTYSNELVAAATPPDWTIETDSLIAGMSPTATGSGNFSNEAGVTGLSALTDGTFGAVDSPASYATCGGANGAGSSVTYTLPGSAYGIDITNIVVYSGWGNADRDGQFYTISYSTVAAPTTYIPLTTVIYNPIVAEQPSANRVQISSTNAAPLAQQVYNLKFDFTPQAGNMDNGYSGYAELIVEGHDSATPPPPPSPYLVQDIQPTHAEAVVGEEVVFTAIYSNSPPASLQWQFITGGVTNDIPGATNATLTLDNLQLTNSGSYLLKAVNATNGGAAPSYSTVAPLVVGPPITVGSVILDYAGQTGPSTFYPAWTINTNNDLIFGSINDSSGNPGTSASGPGNYALQTGLNGDPTILADGNLSDDLASMVSLGWVNVGAGQSMTYTLPSSTYGYNITNITIYGGWTDDGANEQTYQVLYSTVSAPTVFNSIGIFDYKPSFTSGEPNATRTILIPKAGALAQNVYAVELNFNIKQGNDWNGYSEITIGGQPSTGLIPGLSQDITPLTAEDVVGSSLTLSGGFSGATGYQWQKDGTNVPGATTTTLTLTNLKLTDTATNGGYALLGYNAAGTNTTRACSVIVDPAPAAVGNVVTAFAYQTSDASPPNTFGATWDTSALSSSLIYGTYPSAYGTGNFADPDVNFPNSAGGLPILTDGSYGVFAFDGSHPAFACGGPSAGQYVIYTLPAAANGYDVTNIQIAGGWNDNGRNSQYYTVSYSTMATPTDFIPIKAVKNSPSFPTESVIRTTITPAAGLLASNVYAIEVDFTQPPGVPNGYSGYSEISVFGAPSANAQTPPPPGTVLNPSFEGGTTPGPNGGTLPTGWTPFDNNNWCAVASGGYATIPDGTNFFALNEGPSDPTGGIYQDVGALLPNTPYRLTVALGRGPNFGPGSGLGSPGIISLINGTDNTGALLASTNGIPGTAGTWQDYAVNFTTGASVSGDLTIALSVAGASTYQANFDNVRLTTTPVAPTLGEPKASGGNLILTGTGGTPDAGYTWLTTTNLLAPLANWTVSVTGTLDGNGAFSNAIPVSTAQPGRFFRLRMP